MKRSEAMRLRKVIEQAAQSLDDKTALTAIPLHPVWAVGTEYAVGHKIQYGGKLWRVLQTHNSQTGWEPENAANTKAPLYGLLGLISILVTLSYNSQILGISEKSNSGSTP